MTSPLPRTTRLNNIHLDVRMTTKANLFLLALTASVKTALCGLYPAEHIPVLTLGWDERTHELEREIRTEPIILDEFQYLKAFRAGRGDDADSTLMQQAEWSRIYANEIALSGLPAWVVHKFNHYAKGLIHQANLGLSLSLPRETVFCSPKAMLGYKFVNHQGGLEFGLTMSTDQAFPDTVVQAAIKLHKVRYDRLRRAGWDPASDGVNLNDYLHVTASYPRGKNTGLPWMASGSDRFTNDLVLAVDSALACALVRGYPMQRMFDGLLQGYVVFSRFQRTAKSVPLIIDGVRYTSIGIEARRRIINSTMKIVALAIKPAVKFLTIFHLMTPEFEQDRGKLSRKIRQAEETRATDASRFDMRSGGIKLRQGIEVICAFLRYAFPDMPQAVCDLMMHEAFLPTMVSDDMDGGTVARWSSAASLRSGASTTSRVGSIINLMYDMCVYYYASDQNMSTDDLVNLYLETEPSVIQGDDMLKLFRSKADAEHYMTNLGQLERVGMTVEEEHPTKFLGYLVNPLGSKRDDAKGTGLYHSANPLDNMFFPERFRTYAVASMLSRFVILKVQEAGAVVETLTRVAREPTYAMMWYKKFYREVYPFLKPHYEDHPTGAARVYFATLPDPAKVTELRLAAMIKHDEDELLRHIAQTARFDINVKLFGESFDDENTWGDDMVTGSLQHFADMYKGELSERHGAAEGLSKEKFIKKLMDPRIRPLLDALKQPMDDEQFVQAWRGCLDQTSRRVSTDFGDFYVVNL